MLSRIIKLAITALCVFAAWNIGSAYWAHYQFDDKVQQIAQFEVDKDEQVIRSQILDEASRLGLPVTEEKVSVRRQSDHLYIDVSYTRQVQVLPRFEKPWTFTVTAHGWFVPGGRTPLNNNRK